MGLAPEGMTPIATGVEAGLNWAIVHAPRDGAINGYVQLPHGHPWESDMWEGDSPLGDVQVHGGITFGADPGGWIGFDTMHAGDAWGACLYHAQPCGCVFWSAEMVVDEAKRLARMACGAAPFMCRGWRPDPTDVDSVVKWLSESA